MICRGRYLGLPAAPCQQFLLPFWDLVPSLLRLMRDFAAKPIERKPTVLIVPPASAPKPVKGLCLRGARRGFLQRKATKVVFSAAAICGRLTTYIQVHDAAVRFDLWDGASAPQRWCGRWLV